MPALYTQIGPWRLHTFTLALGVVIVLSLVIVARRGQPRGQVVDACLGALVGGVIVARLFHVLLHWDYFVDNLPEARTIGAGGLDWHGAVLGGIAGLWVVVWVQRWWERHSVGTQRAVSLPSNHSTSSVSLRFNVLVDYLTPALPFIGLGAWYGCLAAGCGYGREVDTLANYPAWAASEYVDVFGIVAPRFNTPYFGMVLCGTGLALAGLSGWWRKWRAGQMSRGEQTPALHAASRFWLVLALLSGGMFVIGFFRGDRAFSWLGLRADQILDMIVMVWGVAVVAYQRSGFRLLKNRSSMRDEQAA